MNVNIRSGDINALKLAEHLFQENYRASMIDALVICTLVDEPELSPTDLQELIYGVRRGGSVDKSLGRLRERGLITLTEVNQHRGAKKIVNWTLSGLQFLESLRKNH